ncbi:MAG TPA: choice-of-anchor Q domain-containing protein, partial [Gemmataceae bacterium]|nr:choice-of-anchor Q domain-containing protein [Gemmataceae bacterium]
MNHARALSRLLPARWRPRAGRFRPRLEWLEGRCLPAFLTVTSAADDGTAGTLRVVLGGAQNGDTVGFDPSLVGKTIGLTSGAININTSLDIVGPGVTVSGSNLDRVFAINGSSGQGITVGLTGLTITGGRVVNGSGGGIENVGGNLTLTDCAVIGNTAVTTVGDQSLEGGGIDSFAGVTGSLDIEACLIANNSVSGPGGGAGGGVAFGSTGETLTIHDSTFTGNSAPSQGGALFWSGTGTRDLRDSTFSDNMAPNGGGGGIFAQGGTGEAVACTVVFNRSEFQDAGFTGNGLTLDSSIVAGNIASGVPSDVGPGITSSGHNLILAPGAKFVPGPGDVIGQGPLLGPLADNGGPTPTRALLAGGPGLGAGDPALAGTTDQRGSPRPAAPDIGAYQTEPAVELLVEAPAATAAGAPFQATVEALDAQGNVASTFTGTVTFSSNDPQATLPAGYTFVSADGGVHNFAGLVLRTAGNEAVFVADAAAGFNAVAQLQVLPGPAAAFTLSGLPSPDFAGQPAALTVTARDQFGNVALAYAGTVHFSSSDPAAVLPPDFTFTQADAGAHTFPVTLSSLGPRSVTVTDTSAGITGSASTTVQAVTLLLSGPSQVQAGNPLVLTVTTSPAGAVVNGLTVHWGDGTQDGFAVAPTTVTHVYPQGPNYVGVTLTAITP